MHGTCRRYDGVKSRSLGRPLEIKRYSESLRVSVLTLGQRSKELGGFVKIP